MSFDFEWKVADKMAKDYEMRFERKGEELEQPLPDDLPLVPFEVVMNGMTQNVLVYLLTCLDEGRQPEGQYVNTVIDVLAWKIRDIKANIERSESGRRKEALGQQMRTPTDQSTKQRSKSKKKR